MSSQSKTDPKKLYDYVVKVKGPINIEGALKRKDDVVQLTAKAAKSYAGQVKRARTAKAESLTPPAGSKKTDKTA